MYGPTGEVIYGRDRWPLGARHDEFSDWPTVGLHHKIDLSQSLVRHGEVTRRNVTETVDQSRQKLVARRWDQIDSDRPLASIELAVDVLLEIAHGLRRHPPFTALVVEVEGAAVRCEHPDHPALHHLVKVSEPGTLGNDQLAVAR